MEHKAGIEWVTGHRLGSGRRQGSGCKFGLGINRTPLLDKCFQSIKAIATRSPILKPVDFNKNELVWVIMDSSQMGISAMYGQGKDWDKCQPAGFLSKKFMSAQHNYRMHEHETLVVLEARMKWEDKLLGRKFTVVTNHKGLEYFKTQPNLLPRQTRWWEYHSHFNYDTCWGSFKNKAIFFFN